MATQIIDSSELRDRSGGIRLNGQTIEYVEKRQYIIDAGSKTETRVNVLNTVGLPIVGITQLTTGAICSGLDANTIIENPRYWRVVADFSTQATDQETPPGQQPSPNPTTWIPVWRVNYEKVPFEIIVDKTGKKLVNSAGTKFAGSITAQRTVSVYSFSQYERDNLTESELEDRNETLNVASFKGFPKYSLLLNVVGSERGYYNGFKARKVDYQIKHYKGESSSNFLEWTGAAWGSPTLGSGWRLLAMDVGPEYLDGGGDKTPYMNKGHRCNIELDGLGHVREGDPALLAFEVHELTDFASFIRV